MRSFVRKDHAGANTTTDEISDFLTSRYISASEALWRTFGFQMGAREPAVDPLHYHLPGEDSVTIHGNEDPHAAAGRTVSDLDRYFQRPVAAGFENLTFQAYHEMYVHTTRKPKTIAVIHLDTARVQHYVYRSVPTDNKTCAGIVQEYSGIAIVQRLR